MLKRIESHLLPVNETIAMANPAERIPTQKAYIVSIKSRRQISARSRLMMAHIPARR